MIYKMIKKIKKIHSILDMYYFEIINLNFYYKNTIQELAKIYNEFIDQEVDSKTLKSNTELLEKRMKFAEKLKENYEVYKKFQEHFKEIINIFRKILND